MLKFEIDEKFTDPYLVGSNIDELKQYIDNTIFDNDIVFYFDQLHILYKNSRDELIFYNFSSIKNTFESETIIKTSLDEFIKYIDKDIIRIKNTKINFNHYKIFLKRC